MNTLDATAGDLPQTSNYQIIRRLLKFMRPFNSIMMTSLIARVVKFCGQAAVLGIAAASVGIYVNAAEPGVVNWSIIWTQVGWIALVGTVVGIASYIENYTGHYVAFRILAAFRDRFYYSMLPLAPARTAKLQSGDAVSRVMTRLRTYRTVLRAHYCAGDCGNLCADNYSRLVLDRGAGHCLCTDTVLPGQYLVAALAGIQARRRRRALSAATR